MASRRLKLVDPLGRFLIPVVIDTREQRGFDFYGIAPEYIRPPYAFDGMVCDKADGGKTLEVPTMVGTLKSGDYSLKGFESRVACERKSMADLFSTIGQGRDRFERELTRLAEMEFAAVVIEGTWEDICTDPPPHTQLPPKTVFRSILAWSVRYPRVHWIPAGPRRLAEVTTFRLLEKWVQEHVTQDEVTFAHARQGPGW
jgi:hypothetical protein